MLILHLSGNLKDSYSDITQLYWNELETRITARQPYKVASTELRNIWRTDCTPTCSFEALSLQKGTRTTEPRLGGKIMPFLGHKGIVYLPPAWKVVSGG